MPSPALQADMPTTHRYEGPPQGYPLRRRGNVGRPAIQGEEGGKREHQIYRPRLLHVSGWSNSALPVPVTTPDSSLSSIISIQEYQTVHADSVDTHSGHPSPSSSSRTSRPTKDTTVVFDSVDTPFGNISSSSSRVNTSTQDTASQTSCLDLPPLVLSPIPESRNELEAYLRWLCNTMDQIGRVRESAKLRLEELKEESKLQQEREVRRKLEAEVRRLQKEVAEYKWRDNVFGSTEQWIHKLI